MIQPTRDISLINRIANSDEVRPFVSADGREVDFSPLAGGRPAQDGVVVLTNGEDAIGLFELTADRVFQAHTLFAKTCRGRKAIETARDMIAWMFSHGADVIWGDTPRTNRPAMLFNRLVGMKALGGDETHEIFEMRRAM